MRKVRWFHSVLLADRIQVDVAFEPARDVVYYISKLLQVLELCLSGSRNFKLVRAAILVCDEHYAIRETEGAAVRFRCWWQVEGGEYVFKFAKFQHRDLAWSCYYRVLTFRGAFA